jgi:hypothetical protein
VASPSAQTASPARATSASSAQVVEGGDEGAVGLAEPERAKRAEQQVQAAADLGLGDPDRAAGAAVRQPVQRHRGDGVQADRQGQRRVPPGSAVNLG